MSGRALVVDDDPGVLDVVSFALKREGFDVDQAEDGTAALAEAAARPYDVIILDVMLPGPSGIDICRRIRSESSVPIVMLTAKGDTIDVVQGLEAGADDCLGRPFALEELLARVWGYNFATDTNVVEVYVLYLRRKLEAGGEPRLLHTVRGVGYVLRDHPPPSAESA